MLASAYVMRCSAGLTFYSSFSCRDASNGFLKVYLPYIERLDTLVVMELKLCDSGTLTKVQAREDALCELSL